MSLDTQTIKRRSVKGVISYTARTGFLYLISIVATGLLSVYLSPTDFGIYFVVTAVIGVFTFMSDIGLAATLIQKKSEPTIEELRTTFTVQQVLALLILVICIGLTPVWQHQNHLNQDGIYLLYALALSFLLASWKTIPSILLERRMEYEKIVIPQLVETLAFYGIAVYFAREGWGVKSYTAAVLVRSILGVIAIYIIQRWPIGLAWSKDTFRKLIGFGAKFQANDLLARIKDDLFVAVLAVFLPANQMGLIGWAKRWSMFPYQFSVNNVVSVAFSTFSRLQDDRERLKRALEKAIFFISLLIFPLLMGMAIMAYPLTSLITQYHKWQPALPILFFFCLNIAFAAIANPIINTLNAVGKINQTLKLMVAMTVTTWVITPIAIHFFGPVGVSLAAALVAALSLYALKMIQSVAPVNIWPCIWRQLVATAVMSVYLWVFHDQWAVSWAKFVTGIISGMLIFSVTFLLIGYHKVVSETKSLFARA